MACCEGTFYEPLACTTAIGDPQKVVMCWCVTAACTVSFYLLGEDYLASSYNARNAGKGGKTRKYRITGLCVCCLRAGLAARILLLWFEFSGALDNRVIAVIHWGW